MKTATLIVFGGLVFFLNMVSPNVASAKTTPSLTDFQARMLFSPSPRQLAKEAAGRVSIYSGLTDKLVDRALDLNFERMQSMMFTQIVVTNGHGDVRYDTTTGEPVTEDDGC